MIENNQNYLRDNFEKGITFTIGSAIIQVVIQSYFIITKYVSVNKIELACAQRFPSGTLYLKSYLKKMKIVFQVLYLYQITMYNSNIHLY